MNRKIKVLVAKPGLDGHDRGAKVVAKFLMDAGMEVIYTGIRKTPEAIANIALQEDVDVIGLSSLAGGHLRLFKAVVDQVQEKHLENVLVIGGGVIPEEDITVLNEYGIKKVFTPGSDMATIVDFIRNNVREG